MKKDEFLKFWELDLTTASAKKKYASKIDFEKQKEIEEAVSRYMKENFSFSVLKIDDKKERLDLESKIISTVSLCEKCMPSKKWLGNNSPKEKIRESGLWLVNELYKKPISEIELRNLVAKGKKLR